MSIEYYRYVFIKLYRSSNCIRKYNLSELENFWIKGKVNEELRSRFKEKDFEVYSNKLRNVNKDKPNPLFCIYKAAICESCGDETGKHYMYWWSEKEQTYGMIRLFFIICSYDMSYNNDV